MDDFKKTELIKIALKKILYLGSTLRVQIGKYMSCKYTRQVNTTFPRKFGHMGIFGCVVVQT